MASYLLITDGNWLSNLTLSVLLWIRSFTTNFQPPSLLWTRLGIWPNVVYMLFLRHPVANSDLLMVLWGQIDTCCGRDSKSSQRQSEWVAEESCRRLKTGLKRTADGPVAGLLSRSVAPTGWELPIEAAWIRCRPRTLILSLSLSLSQLGTVSNHKFSTTTADISDWHKWTSWIPNESSDDCSLPPNTQVLYTHAHTHTHTPP